MQKRLTYAVAMCVLAGIVLMSVPVLAETAESKGVCANPVGETIEKTASIKEMQSKPAKEISYTYDMWGRKIPSQTEKSGTI